jgi:hypothetical protein
MEENHNQNDIHIHSLQNYFKNQEEKFTLLLYIGNRLIPFDLAENTYRWILFPVYLQPGNYKLCLLLPGINRYQPISAYGMVFAPGEKIIKHPVQNTLGYGFQITPAIATARKFLPYQNTTEFKTNFDGVHQVGITTTYWTAQTADTIFEVMLLKKKLYSEIANQ